MSTRPSAMSERQKSSPAIQFAVAAVVALLILSLWLHFLLSLEIESIGRDIDVRSAELERLQRANLATMGQITLLESQQRLATEAAGMGFRPQPPLYLAVDQPLTPLSGRAAESALFTIWTLWPGKEAIASQEAEGSPGELAGSATSVANLR